MLRLRFTLAAIIAAIALFVAPATSKADFTVTITNTETGSIAASFDISSNNGIISEQTTSAFSSDYLVGITATSNSPGGAVGEVANDVLSFQTTSTSVAPATFTITTTADGFSSPASPVAVTTNLTINSNLEGASITGVSQINSTNVAGTSITSVSTPSFYTATNPDLTTSSPYAVGNVLTLVMAGGSFGLDTTIAQVTINTQVVAATPAPPGLVMLAGALPFAGLLRLRRLRKSELATAV
jgi:hypothetical protein